LKTIKATGKFVCSLFLSHLSMGKNGANHKDAIHTNRDLPQFRFTNMAASLNRPIAINYERQQKAL
jgi:hypothetical protein